MNQKFFIEPKNVKDWRELYYKERQARVSLQHRCDTYKKQRNTNYEIAKRRKERYAKMKIFAIVSWLVTAVVLGSAIGIQVGVVFGEDQEHFVSEEARTELIEVNLPTALDRKTTDSLPDYVKACVHVRNGGISCSGTIITPLEGYEYAGAVSAAHCFRGVIGGNFQVVNPDGSTTTATLLAMDEKNDIALFKVPTSGVLASSWVPLEGKIPEPGYYSAVGYTAGIDRPIYKVCDFKKGGQPYRHEPNDKWFYHVEKGWFGGGDSGGAVFKNGALVGIISTCERDPASRNNREIGACAHHKLVRFLRDNSSQLTQCGPWGCDPRIGRRQQRRQQPPQRQQRQEHHYRQDVPPQQNPDPGDQGYRPPEEGGNVPPIPVEPDGTGEAPPPPIEDYQQNPQPLPLPSQEFTQLSSQINSIKTQLNNLHIRVDGLAQQPGMPGPPGPPSNEPGPEGPPGEPGPGFVRVWTDENKIFYETTKGDVVNAGDVECVCDDEDDGSILLRLDALEVAINNLAASSPTPIEEKRTHFVLVADPGAEYWPQLERRYNEAADDFSTKLVLKPAVEIEGELPALVLYKEGIPLNAWRGRDLVFQRLLDIAQGHANRLLE